MELRQALRSVVVITVTPFDAEDRIDEKAYGALVARVVEAGVGVVTPNGNTSEFYSLTPAELDRALDLTFEAAGDALVLPGIGFDAARAAEMAVRAHRAGARAAMVHQPVHPFLSVRGWVDYHLRIAAAAPELGLVAYVRSPQVTTAALAQLARECPSFIGVKYAVPDPLALADAVAVIGQDRLTWLCGLAESWAPFFATAGAQGFTSGLATIAPELSIGLLDALESGDRARAMSLWHKVKPLEDARARLGSANNVSVVKEALAQLGLCGRAVRPPIAELTEPERAEVSRILATWD
ncbi:dihydrodipicolinate synthase family protein [Crossiella cryophila]|uniref:4-hydroxy-tetrahydrodipicolinate synthase n=1 Tax=Crossiella cryophila TaxID=43355 RepID=A0A7W7C7Q6_9PSEU|nr:dihydrodipicolinate synthase family protein [Crossiella cryophila]MBB4676031.1 4-hydroxy-tetrahydrodipicolinate synthase [Crossiella cryophila]